MRTCNLLARCLVFAFVSSLAACGGGGMSADGGGDDGPPPDAAIQPPARGFQIVTPDVVIMPGQEITYCYYFRTPNTEPMAIKKWVSEMTPGSHHLIMFTTGTTDKMPPGTISAANCGFGATGNSVPSWTYSAQTASATMELPTDDGTGKPLGIDIPASSAGFVQMHYFNPSDQPVTAHVTINAEALDAGAAYTKTAAFVTYNNNINIPAGATNDVETQTCDGPPAGTKFWLMSTHAHKQAIKTEVLDGTSMVFSSTDWEHPVAEKWMAAPFKTFASGKVTYRCTYNNPNPYNISSGDSAATDEMCMASGYFFPATKPLICFNNLGPF
ncbi:MAG: hypothetical protein H0X17_07780 [Deltaproteobacteria bacterium]|nr:hypothetical protein [Deltaproteobacteria bacterium]